MEAAQVAQLPPTVYITLGVLVLSNVGTLFTLLTLIFKAGVFVADTKNGIKDAKDTAVRAHKRIDKVEGADSGGE